MRGAYYEPNKQANKESETKSEERNIRILFIGSVTEFQQAVELIAREILFHV